MDPRFKELKISMGSKFAERERPTAPECPAVARNFINALVMNGTDLATAVRTVEQYVLECQIPSFPAMEWLLEPNGFP